MLVGERHQATRALRSASFGTTRLPPHHLVQLPGRRAGMSVFTFAPMRGALPSRAMLPQAARPQPRLCAQLPVYTGLRLAKHMPCETAGGAGRRLARWDACVGGWGGDGAHPASPSPPPSHHREQQQQPERPAERRDRVCDAPRRAQGAPGAARRPAQGARALAGDRGAAPRQDQDHQGGRGGGCQSSWRGRRSRWQRRGWRAGRGGVSPWRCR